MSKGRRKQFGESPAEILLKQRLGTVKYNQLKDATKKPKKVKKVESPWGKGVITELAPGEVVWGRRQGGYYYGGFDPGGSFSAGVWDKEQLAELMKPINQHAYVDENGNSQTENNAKPEPESWADKWAKENGRD